MTKSARWTLVVLAALVGLVIVLVLGVRDDPPNNAGRQRDAQSPQALAGARQRADLLPCPEGGHGPGPERLRGLSVECAADGSAVDVARALAGGPVVLNLWAYWCVPCVHELPAMAEFQRRAGTTVTVVTVHQDQNEVAALLRLADLGVRLPTLQDAGRKIAAALQVPNVMPATVVLRSDGSVAKVLPQAFTTVEEIATAAKNALQ